MRQTLHAATFVLLIAATYQVFGQSAKLSLAAADQSTRPKAPTEIRQSLLLGHPQDVLVEFDDTDIQSSTTEMRRNAGVKSDNAATLKFKATEYVKLKQSAMAGMAVEEHEKLIEYSHLPLAFVRIKTAAALDALLAEPRVKAIHKNEIKWPVLDSVSAGFVNQPAVYARGFAGAGATVAVIDSGVNYTQADFGCTSPGVPAGCKVNYYANLADSSTNLDSLGHGTNVSGIVVGVAPGAKVAALNVFGAKTTTTDALIISAMNWVIANKATYNIVSINLSLGDNINHGNGMTDCVSNAYYSPVFNAGQAGIGVYAAAGNNGFSNGVTSPACTYTITAVGAVHDAIHESINFGSCTDPSGGADQTACFTNLPPLRFTGSKYVFDSGYSYVMAPGVNVTAGGITYSGTSQATPFVAAARAIKQAAIPSLTAAQKSLGGYINDNCTQWASVPITRSGYNATAGRLDLTQCLSDTYDNFANGVSVGKLTTSNIVFSSENVFATKEAGEPNHAGNAGGHSVWADFTTSVSSQVQIDTHVSGFDTLLAVYTGTSVSALTLVASNDDDGSASGTSSVIFQAQPGTDYKIAVDGKNGATGNYALSIKYASSDLTLTVNSTEISPTKIQYSVYVSNAGPANAPNAKVNINLPTGITFYSVQTGSCSANGSNVVTCLLGTIKAPSGSASATFTANVSSLGNYTTTATVSSDYSDPIPSDDSSTVQTTVAPFDYSDVPTLPEWGMIVLGCLLLGSVHLQYRNGSSRKR
jgi:uncharacterized repeat protein (TIGR01451 family)